MPKLTAKERAARIPILFSTSPEKLEALRSAIEDQIVAAKLEALGEFAGQQADVALAAREIGRAEGVRSVLAIVEETLLAETVVNTRPGSAGETVVDNVCTVLRGVRAKGAKLLEGQEIAPAPLVAPSHASVTTAREDSGVGAFLSGRGEKPCPYCGAKADTRGTPEEPISPPQACCPDDECPGSYQWIDIPLWNKRAPSVSPVPAERGSPTLPSVETLARELHFVDERESFPQAAGWTSWEDDSEREREIHRAIAKRAMELLQSQPVPRGERHWTDADCNEADAEIGRLNREVDRHLARIAELEKSQPVPTSARVEQRVAVIQAHRATHAAEHDPANGKLHGYCIVCGVPFPCAYVGEPPTSPPAIRAALGRSGEASTPPLIRECDVSNRVESLAAYVPGPQREDFKAAAQLQFDCALMDARYNARKIALAQRAEPGEREAKAQRENFARGNLAIDRAPDSRRTFTTKENSDAQDPA